MGLIDLESKIERIANDRYNRPKMPKRVKPIREVKEAVITDNRIPNSAKCPGCHKDVNWRDLMELNVSPLMGFCPYCGLCIVMNCAVKRKYKKSPPEVVYYYEHIAYSTSHVGFASDGV